MQRLTACFAGLMLMLMLMLGAGTHARAAGPADSFAPAFAGYGPGTPGCAVATVQDGKTDRLAGFGMANLQTGAALTPDTVFDAASLSKQMTVFVLLTLEQQGKLKQNDSIRKFLPELGAYAQDVTLSDLIHHTSGLRDAASIARLKDGFDPKTVDESWTDASILEVLGRQKGGDTPHGTFELYSNTGFRLLAIAAERVSGKPLQALLSEMIFQPLGMKDSFLFGAEPSRPQNLAVSYRLVQEKFQPVPTSPPFRGAGSVWTSVSDLSRWMENFISGRVGGVALMRELGRVPPLANGGRVIYGGGLMRSVERGMLRLEHGGSIDGFRHRMVIYPDQKFAIVVLCNRADAGVVPRIDAITDAYLAPLTKEKRAAPKEQAELVSPRNIDAAQARVGWYRETHTAEYLRISRTANGGTQVRYRNEELPLSPVGGGVYRSKDLSAFPGFANFVAFSGTGLDMASAGEFERYEWIEDWQPDDLSRWAGTYWSDEAQGHLQLVMKDGALQAHLPLGTVPVQPGGKGEFVFRGGALFVPADGPADRLTIHQLGIRGVQYRRQDAAAKPPA